jgi:hypothetical protein
MRAAETGEPSQSFDLQAIHTLYLSQR